MSLVSTLVSPIWKRLANRILTVRYRLRLKQENEMFARKLEILSRCGPESSEQAQAQSIWRKMVGLRSSEALRDNQLLKSDSYGENKSNTGYAYQPGALENVPPLPSPLYNDFTLFSVTKENAHRQIEVNWYLRQRAAAIDQWMARNFGLSVAFVFVVTMIIQVTTKTHQIWPTIAWTHSCPMGWEFLPAWTFGVVFFFVVCPILLWKLRATKDPHLVQVDVYLCVVVGLPFSVLGLVWWVFIDPKFPNSFSAGNVFLMMVAITGHISSIVMPLWKAIRDEKRKRRRKLLMNLEHFIMVLDDPVLSYEFRAFTIADSCVELIIFYQEYQNLQRQARAILLSHIPQIGDGGANITTDNVLHPLSGFIRRLSNFMQQTPENVEDAEQAIGMALANPASLPPNSTVSQPDDAGSRSMSSTSPASLTGSIRLSASIRKHVRSISNGSRHSPKRRAALDGSAMPASLDDLVAVSPVPKELRPLFVGFFQMFVKYDAPMAVNVSHEVLQSVTGRIERKELVVGMFDRVKDEVVKNLASIGRPDKVAMQVTDQYFTFSI
ncbi:hypothetical protein SpCBS45565_g06621 [Spizellomyces sp. 'palustris']|nr:hypothetical protein SpCBS45565_g06621 [Spizellomyces sp. 'palustris']